MSQQEDEHSLIPPFHVDEHVFVKDGDKNSVVYYEAIIRQARYEEDEWVFLVHYKGWNSRWDQWKSSNNLLKRTDETVALVAQRDNEQKLAAAVPEEEEPRSSSGSKRRRRASDAATPSSLSKRRSHLTSTTLPFCDECSLPFTLQTILVDEYECLTGTGHRAGGNMYSCQKPLGPEQLHNLPSSVPISKVLNHFFKKKIKEIRKGAVGCDKTGSNGSAEPATNGEEIGKDTPATATIEQINAFRKELEELFEVILPRFLLYPHEKDQYKMIIAEQGVSSLLDIYGCEYLLRFYVKMPELLQGARIGHEALVGSLLRELLVLMQKNRATLFPKEYMDVPRQDENTQQKAGAKAK